MLTTTTEVAFDLGEDITAVVQRFGKPDRADLTGNVHTYQYFSLPTGTTAKFSHQGTALKSVQTHGLLLVTDTRFDAGRLSDATIAVNAEAFTTHSQAQVAITDLIAQFQNGDWKRYIPDSCPWVTGRSTLLDASGRVSISACPLDPALVISAQEWPQIAAQKLLWQWIGDGRIATLEATYAYDKPNVPTYTINLQFELQEAVKFYDAQSLREMKAEFGEAKVAAGAAKGAAEIKLLEEAAIKRGDSTITRP